MTFSTSVSGGTDWAPEILAFCVLLWLIWISWSALRPREQYSFRSVAILVLGDIGRSPRMMYHAQSFAQHGFAVDLVGYGGSKPIPALERLPKIQFRHLRHPPKLLNRLPFIVSAPMKVFYQVMSILLMVLWIKIPPEFILVQNPPSIPSLMLVQLIARLRGSKVIIDWHNLGYTILAMRLGASHPLVRLSMWLEGTFGRSAYAHLFVTDTMRNTLIKKWDLQGHKVVLHDRPPNSFHRCSPQETHELFQRLQPTFELQLSLQGFLPESSLPYSTPFTHSAPQSLAVDPTMITTESQRVEVSSPAGTPAEIIPSYAQLRIPVLRSDRPVLLVSSTSWTADEDFGILLDAMCLYESRARDWGSGLPKLFIIITGKGPLKNKYMKQVNRLQFSWKYVRCISLWLTAQDYPILLGSADLGVSLHSSSSALDLPMKIVDMFGCGLPVCALNFACIFELVKEGKNGLLFENGVQLSEQWEHLFASFPHSHSPRLNEMRNSLKLAHHGIPTSTDEKSTPETGDWCTWEDNWSRVVRPLILKDVTL